VLARQQGRGLAEVAVEAGAALLAGPASLKAALDLDWDDPMAVPQALRAVLAALAAVEAWLDGGPAPAEATADPWVQRRRAAAQQVRDQDVEVAADGIPTLRRGGSRDRRSRVEDGQMRHGRQSRAVRVDGSKRQVLHDLGSGLVCAVGLPPANAPEASVTEALDADLATLRGVQRPVTAWAEGHLNRADLSSRWVRDRPETLAI
jgi:transposase